MVSHNLEPVVHTFSYEAVVGRFTADRQYMDNLDMLVIVLATFSRPLFSLLLTVFACPL